MIRASNFSHLEYSPFSLSYKGIHYSCSILAKLYRMTLTATGKELYLP